MHKHQQSGAYLHAHRETDIKNTLLSRELMCIIILLTLPLSRPSHAGSHLISWLVCAHMHRSNIFICNIHLQYSTYVITRIHICCWEAMNTCVYGRTNTEINRHSCTRCLYFTKATHPALACIDEAHLLVQMGKDIKSSRQAAYWIEGRHKLSWKVM